MTNADNTCKGPTSNTAFVKKIINAQHIILKQGQHLALDLNGFHATTSIDISRPASPSPAANSTHSPPTLNPYALPPHQDVLEMIDIFFDNTGKFFPYLYKPYILQNFIDMRRSGFQNVERSQFCILNLLMAFATTHCPSDLPVSLRVERGDVFLHRALLLIPDIKPAAGNLEPSTYAGSDVAYTDHGHSTGVVNGDPIHSGYSEIITNVGHTWQAHPCGLPSRPLPAGGPRSL
jgi:hypothetical protein